MNQTNLSLTRRKLFVTGGLGAIAVASASSAATDPIAGITPVEKANIQLIRDFCQAWGEDPPDAEKLVGQFLTDDCVVRFGETIQPVAGQDGALSLFQTFLNNGERYDLKIIETFARGPLVVNSRIDSTVKGKKTTNPTSVVGVFFIKDSKIKEWSDYV